MKIHITKSLEEILNLKENPVPIHKLAGKSALILTPYWGDKIINKIRKEMIRDLTEEYKAKEKHVNPQAIKKYSNLLSGMLWLGKYYMYAHIGYKLYTLLT